MNIVDYWKNLVSKCQSYKDFCSNEEFIEKLNENVPDWRLQVKDKNLWPELHSYSQNVAETYVSLIINEAGLDFAGIKDESFVHLFKGGVRGPRRNPAERFRWGEEEQTKRCEKWPTDRFERSGVYSDEGGALVGSGEAR